MESINPVDNPVEVPRHSMKAQDGQPERREDPKLAVVLSCRYSNPGQLREQIGQLVRHL